MCAKARGSIAPIHGTRRGSVRIKSHDPAPPNPYSHTPSKAPAPRDGASLRSGIQGLSLTRRTHATAHLGPLVKVFFVPAGASRLWDIRGERNLEGRRTVISSATPDAQIPILCPQVLGSLLAEAPRTDGQRTLGLLPLGGGVVEVEGRVPAPYLPQCSTLVSAGSDTEPVGLRVRPAPDMAQGKCRALRAAPKAGVHGAQHNVALF